MLQEVYGVRTFAVGGLENEPMAYSEFSGGQVYRATAIIAEASRFKLDDAPKEFPVNSAVSFTLREAYSKKNPEVPLEFGRLFNHCLRLVTLLDYAPASDRILLDEINTFSPGSIWLDVAEKMNFI